MQPEVANVRTVNARNPEAETLRQRTWLDKLLGLNTFDVRCIGVTYSSAENIRAMIPYIKRLHRLELFGGYLASEQASPYSGIRPEGRICLYLVGNADVDNALIAELERELPNCYVER